MTARIQMTVTGNLYNKSLYNNIGKFGSIKKI